jgi:hypothetical protein
MRRRFPAATVSSSGKKPAPILHKRWPKLGFEGDKTPPFTLTGPSSSPVGAFFLEQKCYVLRETQTSVGCRTSRSSARFYIGALCNSAIKLAAPKRRAALFCVARRFPPPWTAAESGTSFLLD